MSDRPLYGCQAVIEAAGLTDIEHCVSCHGEMQYADETPSAYMSWHCGTLPDGREYEDVCCGVSTALREKEEEREAD